jgi:outer membrane biosynthesis protein TonB
MRRGEFARCVALACCGALALMVSARAQQQATPDPASAAQQPAAPTAQPDAAQPPNPLSPTAPTAPPPATPADAVPAAPTAPTPAAPVATTPAASTAAQPPPAATPAANAPEEAQTGGITEEEVKQLLVGKALYLRGGYLDNSLSFDEHGRIIGRSPEGSYTLSAIEISRVSMTKHKVEMEGIRYALHFNEQLAYEDPTTAYDKVRITPKKKVVKITIDREMVVTPKKPKEPAAKEKNKETKVAGPAAEPAEVSEADQLKAAIAAAPAAERPADPGSVTTTISPAHAAQVLRDALGQIFAQGLDDRMMAAMPDFWKLYYQAVAEKADYRPKDPAILRQNTVDQKARLLSTFEPDSNEFAQANGVAGMALYHTVIGSDGKAQEIAVGRPIGFGLDENAVAAIRKASFQPAVKDGKPVPVLLDLVVQFRIFSKRTAVASQAEPADKPAEPVLPGPYSLQHP